ncbi:RNA ligase/cyclic nucleotide phosphodiesterase [Schizophyllum fasciatum]
MQVYNSACISKGANPFDALLTASDQSEQAIQRLYENHRLAGYAQNCATFRSPKLAQQLRTDPILSALERARTSSADADNIDTRHCLTLVAIPAPNAISLAQYIQSRLKNVAPHLWFAPAANMHLTLLELVVAKTEEDVELALGKLGAQRAGALVRYPGAHPTRLVRPRLNVDLGGLALSFVPEEKAAEKCGGDWKKDAAPFTYLHLRRELYALAADAGVKAQARYTVPSAHITLARFISAEDFNKSGEGEGSDMERISAFLRLVEAINDELAELDCAWTVGEAGVELRKGKTWYGGGAVVCRA